MQNSAEEQKPSPPKQAKPRFRPDIIAHNFEEEAQGRSIVLEDPVANKFFRVSSYEYELLRVLDGKLTLQEAIYRLRLRGRYFTEESAVKLINQCSRNGLILATAYGSAGVMSALRKSMKKAATYRSLNRMYFIFVPILNPDRFLDKTLWLWNLLVNRYTGGLLLAAVPGAVYLFAANLQRYTTEFLFFFNLSNLLVLWIAIGCVKLSVMSRIAAHTTCSCSVAIGLKLTSIGISSPA